MSKVLEQIDLALTSTDDSDAVRLWLWLRITHGGECTVFEMLTSGLPEIVPSANKLFAAQRIRFVRDRVVTQVYTQTARRRRSTNAILDGLSGRERYRTAVENPRAKVASQAIREAEAWFFEAQNRVRVRHKVRPLPDSQRTRFGSQWRAAARFVLVNNIDPEKFVEFAYERTRWQHSKFPAAALLGGDWVRQEWADKDAGKAREHAGHKYSSDGNLKDALVEAGFDRAKTFDDKMTRHVYKMAKVLKSAPALREPHSDAEIEEMVQWTAKNHEVL